MDDHSWILVVEKEVGVTLALASQGHKSMILTPFQATFRALVEREFHKSSSNGLGILVTVRLLSRPGRKANDFPSGRRKVTLIWLPGVSSGGYAMSPPEGNDPASQYLDFLTLIPMVSTSCKSTAVDPNLYHMRWRITFQS